MIPMRRVAAVLGTLALFGLAGWGGDATVEVHVKAILKKLGAPGRAVVIAMMHGRG